MISDAQVTLMAERGQRDYRAELREENRILRYALAEAVHELGRAIHVSDDALLSRAEPRPVVILRNEAGACYIIAPEMSGEPRV